VNVPDAYSVARCAGLRSCQGLDRAYGGLVVLTGQP
jgi:hypothetical protein